VELVLLLLLLLLLLPFAQAKAHVPKAKGVSKSPQGGSQKGQK
jgi:hypothetical protein